MRKSILIAIVLLGVVLLTSTSAYASGGVTCDASGCEIDFSSLDSGAKTDIEQKILEWDSPPGDSLWDGVSISEDAQGGLAEAAQAGGVEASLSTVAAAAGTAAIVAAGSYEVYRVAKHAGLSDWVYRKVWGDPACSAFCGGTAGTMGWVYASTHGTRSGFDLTAVPQPLWTVEGSNGYGPTYCQASAACTQVGKQQIYAALHGGELGLFTELASTGSIVCGTGTATTCYYGYRTVDQMDREAKIVPSNVTEYNATPSGSQWHPSTTIAGAHPDTCDATCLQDALNKIHANDSSQQTPQEKAAVTALAIPEAPPFTILQPLVNETYTDYVTRLQNDGWLGATTSETEETSALSGYGPNAVTRVSYTGEDGLVHTLDPLHWPTAVPGMRLDTDIVLRYNPSTATPAPTDSSTDTCGTTGNPCITQDNTPSPGDSPCSTCAIDWTPIESLDVGSKFPFGVPTWVSGFFGDVTFADSCPTLSIGKPSAIGGGSVDIPFCSSEWESTYRPIVFPILEALMTLAAITFLGSKIFGIGGGESE